MTANRTTPARPDWLAILWPEVAEQLAAREREARRGEQRR